MAQQQSSVPTDKVAGDEYSHTESNNLVSVVNYNATDTETRLSSLNSGKEASLGNPTEDGQVLSSTIGGTRAWVTPASSEDLSWVIGQTTGVPIVVWDVAEVQINTTGTIPIYLIGGNPATSYEVTTGSLPPEFTLQSDGNIAYTTTSSTSTGSFGITASNPAGSADEVTVNYEISQAHGMAQFTNSETPYLFLRVSTTNSTPNQLLIIQATTAWGYPTSTSNGTWVSDTNYPVWAADNGDGTYTYLVRPNGYSYWNLYVSRSSSPSDLTNGNVTDLTTGAGTYDLVAPTSDEITLGTVIYPADQSDIHYGTGQNFIRIGSDASLNGFLSDNNSWSYGFKLVDAWQRDGLGRTMFCREGRNFHAIYVGHNDTYTAQIVGNGSTKTYDSEDIALPAGGFAAGSYVRITFNGSVVDVYVNGTRYWQYNATSYWDSAASTDVLDVVFGKGPESNLYQTNNNYFHGFWQGQIERLWVANGTVVASDDDGATYPTGTTHAWDLDEVTGADFYAAIGSIDAVGEKV
jgi:hypothetical protein